MQKSGTDIGCTEFVKLPRPGDGKLSCSKIILLSFRCKNHGAGFEENDFNSFVSMRFFTPIGCTISIPKADGAQARQNIFWHQRAGIMSFCQSMPADLA